MRDKIRKILKEEEESDFKWIDSVPGPIPIQKVRDIMSEIQWVGDVSVDAYDLISSIHKLALREEEIKDLARQIYRYGEKIYADADSGGHERGFEEGYSRGKSDGWYDARDEYDEKINEAYDDGVEEGKYYGEKEGYEKGYKKGYEIGHEEGIEYQKETEYGAYRDEEGDLYDPKDYDGGYD